MRKKLFTYFLGGIVILVCITVFGGIRKDIKVACPISSISSPDSNNEPVSVVKLNKDYFFFQNTKQSLDSIKRGCSEEYLMKVDTSYIERIEYSPKNDLLRSIVPLYWSRVTVAVTSNGLTLKQI